MLRKRLRRQIPELRAMELLQHAFAIKRLHLRAVQLERIDSKSPGTRLGHGPLQHLLAARAPELQLDAILLLEGFGDRHRVLEIERGADDCLPLLLRTLENALVALRPLAHVQIAMPAGCAP